jgi:adenosylcobinamide-GDP ribazoletransferase
MTERLDRPPLRGPGPAAALLADTAGMVRFFSRLPVPRLGQADDPAAMPDFATAPRMLPIAGLVIAAPAALVLALAGAAGLPALAAAGIALAVLVLTTGGLHEDGLADVADGFGGGATRERKLEVMKDSRVGSYGATALALSLLIRAALLAGILDAAGPIGAALALAAVGAVARAAALVPLALLPPARPGGASAAAGRPSGATLAIALVLSAAIAIGLAGAPFGLARPGAGVVLAVAAALAMTAIARRQIGGQTGDVAGAAEQLAEIAFLAVLAAR